MTIPYEAALDERPDNECIHGMIPAYCADCLGHKDADEEELEDFKHWSKIADSSRKSNSRGQS
jgi:hypothetical protein